MKAKYFKKLRESLKYYDVETSYGLFGTFNDNWNRSIKVLASSYQGACYRAKKRGYGRNKTCDTRTNEVWGQWRVKLHGKSSHYRNVIYFY